MKSSSQASNFVLGPKSNSYPRRPQSASHHVHSVARQLFVEMPQWMSRALCVAAMRDLRLCSLPRALASLRSPRYFSTCARAAPCFPPLALPLPSSRCRSRPAPWPSSASPRPRCSALPLSKPAVPSCSSPHAAPPAPIFQSPRPPYRRRHRRTAAAAAACHRHAWPGHHSPSPGHPRQP